MASEASTRAEEDFSLVLGGPLYQLLIRVGLIRPSLDRISWRLLIIVGLAWLPLAVLTLLEGRFSSGVRVPFIEDYDAQARLLAVLPLLIAAEVLMHRKTRGMIQQFLERQIVTPEDRSRFDVLLASTMRLRNSVAIELAMAVLVFGFGSFVWRAAVALDTDTWYASVLPEGKRYTLAGYWFGFLSVPLIQFILLRWYFRLFLWARLLWNVARLDLRLVALHPDRACGLGFLSEAVVALAPFLMAHSFFLAGYMANRILHGTSKLPEFRPEMVVLAAFLLLLSLGPVCVFAPALNRARLNGLRGYGRLASSYVLDFDRKWLGERAPEGEALLGTADIQSLADLSNSFEVVRSISVFPFGRRTLTQFAVIVALPILPLTLTMFPLSEIVGRLVKIVL
jgi:hypothetical protein